jgi:hypothetical protein
MAANKTKPGGLKPDKLMRDALMLSLKRAAEVGKPTRRLQLVADRLVDCAIGGDVGAIREIFDRVDGRVPQALTGEDGGPILVKVEDGWARNHPAQ